ncbi:MAG: RNA polymerase factor sigma-54 [Thermodesulfobacteriota bacterium]
MGLELRQQLKLSQQLVMTPQLQQAIKLLQLSRLELMDVVQTELLENPLLEETANEQETEPEEGSLDDEQYKEVLADENDLRRNADWEDYLGEFSSTAKQTQIRETEIPEEMQAFEARYSSKPSLEGHLLWQLHLSDLSPEEIRVGEILIGHIDDRGYLDLARSDLSAITEVDEETANRVLARIHFFDPVGVGARDLQECLLLQLKAADRDDPVLEKLIREHLEDIERKRFQPLLKKFKLSKEEMWEYLLVLQSLDPYPGSDFGTEQPIYVSPDVFVYEYENDFVIVMNDDGLPKLQLSPFYGEELNSARNKKSGSRDDEYLQDKMRSAMWLMKSLQQRQRTLYKVSESLVRFQREFFEHGVSRLKPLILKDVAEDIEMHESTVSRITTSKYMSTPHGIYELKFFFNSGIGSSGGDDVGSGSVKAAIKELIESEDNKRPYSDEAIAKNLEKNLGVNIARRTVAKYRTALNIPSSSKRKQFF